MGCVLLFEDLIRVWLLLGWTLPCWMGGRQHLYLWPQLTLWYWTSQDIRCLLMPREKFALGAWIQTGRAVAPRSTSTSSRQSRLLISAGFAQYFPVSMTSFTPALKESHRAAPCVLPTARSCLDYSPFLEVKPFLQPTSLLEGPQRGETAEGGVGCTLWNAGSAWAHPVGTGGVLSRNIHNAGLALQCATSHICAWKAAKIMDL